MDVPSTLMAYPLGSELLVDDTSPSSSYDSDNDDKGLWDSFIRRRRLSVVNMSTQSRNHWKSLLMGQFIAIIATSMNAATYAMEFGMGLVMPFFLMTNMYLILSIHLRYCERVPRNRSDHSEAIYHRLPFTDIKLQLPWKTYLLLSIVDVGPNYLTLMSLKYTSLASATLLLSLTVPSTMIFCQVLLRKKYHLHHGLGVVMCMFGGFLTLRADSNLPEGSGEASSLESHPHSYFGDLLALSAAILYGLGDAAGEYWTKHIGRVEYLGMIGLGGAFYSIIISFLLERDVVLSLFSGEISILPVLIIVFWYTLSVVTYYICATLFYLDSDATLLNISLQASNLWAFLFSIMAYKEFPPRLFYFAACFVVGGVVIYELGGRSMGKGRDNSTSNDERLPLNQAEQPPIARGKYQTIS